MLKTLVLDKPDLIQNLEEVAKGENTSPEDLLEQAVAEFLEKISLRVLQSESETFKEIHSQLVEKHFGQHVAIHNRELVDFDMDRNVLRKRIRQKYGRVPILLREVTNTPDIEQFFIYNTRLEPALS